MDSDSGLASSPTLEEDSCLQLHGGIYDATPSDLDRALLEPRSTSAQLDAVEALARQVEGLLSRRLDQYRPNQRREEEDDDGFEFTAELTGFSLSPVVSDSNFESKEQTVFGLKTDYLTPDRVRRKKTALRPTKSLDAYQKYPRAASSIKLSSVGATADKYRLSFVGLSDSSEEQEESGYLRLANAGTDTARHAGSVTGSGVSRVEENLISEAELKCGKVVDHCVRNRESEDAHLLPGGLESAQNSIGQFADLQYDDEDIAPTHSHNRLMPNSSNASVHSSVTQQQTAVFRNYNETHHKTVVPAEHDLLYEDEDMELFIPPSKNSLTPTKTATPSHSSQTTSPGKRSTGRSAVVENITTVQNNYPQSATCVDHASFSPLYKMTVIQLQYSVQLLETKLQGG